MQLETERLIIREFTHEDMEAVHEYASDPVVTTHMIWGPNSVADTRSFIEQMITMQERRPREGYELAVTLKESGKLIGGTGLYVMLMSQGEIGYCYNRQYWGQGYATEAASALLHYGFRELGLHRIYATCRPGNVGSATVMRKLGMSYEGHLREHMFHKDKWHDSYLYSILEHEYKVLSQHGQQSAQ
ncbi:GNAT family N-acetyltransferase [Paenibacillus paeoniae]|uniref:N-acetyltransferase n=1 Tax=Paenibacillus paeoniae TaxID=2292705 RepID=A0A371P6B2_9BACL|nr:GNAT family N-acetyltransferase [Paenibacillus paeoniae]REK71432.1 N-acetyltransferase [Paenibacillus paeoniae]